MVNIPEVLTNCKTLGHNAHKHYDYGVIMPRHVNREKKSLKIADHLPTYFLTFLTAQRNSGASGEVNYRYLKFISCIFFLKLFLYFNTKLVNGKKVSHFLIIF